MMSTHHTRLMRMMYHSPSPKQSPTPNQRQGPRPRPSPRVMFRLKRRLRRGNRLMMSTHHTRLMRMMYHSPSPKQSPTPNQRQGPRPRPSPRVMFRLKRRLRRGNRLMMSTHHTRLMRMMYHSPSPKQSPTPNQRQGPRPRPSPRAMFRLKRRLGKSNRLMRMMYHSPSSFLVILMFRIPKQSPTPNQRQSQKPMLRLKRRLRMQLPSGTISPFYTITSGTL